MSRYALALISGLAGLAALALLLPLFDAPQPRGLRITPHDARVIADPVAKSLGIPVDESWPLVTWENSMLLEEELAKNSSLRRRAAADPVAGPRVGGYRVTYFRRGASKFPEHGFIIVDPSGEVTSARRMARAEDRGAAPLPESVRARADAFVRSRTFPGAPDPGFDSIRPDVLRGRTDHQIRYRVPSRFPLDNVAFYLSVYYIGDQFGGWRLIDEYRDGRPFRFDLTEALAGTLAQLLTVFGLLILLLAIFLRKYHAGEVGVGTGSVILAFVTVAFIVFDFMTMAENSMGTQFGGADARTTALAQGAFKFVVFDFPVAVVVFLAWSVGESFARERWGEKLAAFDAIFRRDVLNATVGRSLLHGVFLAPAVAAATLAISYIPVLLGIATPTIGPQTAIVATRGGACGTITVAVIVATIIAVVAYLFVLGYAKSRRVLVIGVLVALPIGTLLTGLEPPINPVTQTYLFGFGGVLAGAFIFLALDLLSASTAIFGGVILLGLAPFARVVEGSAATGPLLGLTVPLFLLFALAVAGLLTRREVAYTYEDLAPHVRRIVERERVKAEIEAANRIQAALLPSEDPRLSGVTIASHYCAASEIGGDYFDFLPVSPGITGVAFGDVAGHGLTSGIVMAMAKAALLVQIGYDASPKRVMQVLNETVIKTAPRRMLMTFFFGLLDADRQELRFSPAGHLDPYVYRAATGRIEALSSWGFPLGVRRRDDFRELAVSFAPGDRLILYSDGFIEALDDEGEPFGFDRFEKVLLEAATRSADEIKRALLAAVKRFTRNRPPEDDQTLVVITFDASDALSRTA
ncbi:MAG: PP2C family protein-serine/threonine phosphatase [Thermoanaerobaculia bacterium]